MRTKFLYRMVALGLAIASCIECPVTVESAALRPQSLFASEAVAAPAAFSGTPAEITRKIYRRSSDNPLVPMMGLELRQHIWNVAPIILIRGTPGTGKSTLADTLRTELNIDAPATDHYVFINFTQIKRRLTHLQKAITEGQSGYDTLWSNFYAAFLSQIPAHERLTRIFSDETLLELYYQLRETEQYRSARRLIIEGFPDSFIQWDRWRAGGASVLPPPLVLHFAMAGREDPEESGFGNFLAREFHALKVPIPIIRTESDLLLAQTTLASALRVRFFPFLQRKANAFVAQGHMLLQIKEPTKALESFDRALAIQNDLHAARLGRALALGAFGHFSKAMKEAAEAVLAKPDDIQGYITQVKVYERAGRRSEAIEMAEAKLAEIGPQPDLILELVRIIYNPKYPNFKSYMRAAAHIKESLERFPEHKGLKQWLALYGGDLPAPLLRNPGAPVAASA